MLFIIYRTNVIEAFFPSLINHMVSVDVKVKHHVYLKLFLNAVFECLLVIFAISEISKMCISN